MDRVVRVILIGVLCYFVYNEAGPWAALAIGLIMTGTEFNE